MHSKRSTTTKIRPNLLRLMVENAVDAQYLVDIESDEFMQCNEALCDLLGRSVNELVGAGFKTLDMVHDTDREYLAKTRRSMNPSDSRKLRFRCIRPDGTVRWVEARTRMATYMGRKITVGSARDVSEQVELESRLRKRLEADGSRLKASEERAQEAIQSSHMSMQMLDTLSAIPELSKILSSKDRVADVLKEACLFITDLESGLKYASCAIYSREGNALDVAYANPFMLTTHIEASNVSPEMRSLLDGEATSAFTASGRFAVPINTKDQNFGVLEVSFGKALEALIAGSQALAAAQEHVVSSIADFLGILISNLDLRASIRQQVIEDVLTGLYNRRFFHEKLDIEFRRALRYERDLSLLILDIDHFKVVNDTHGHAQGDLCLEEIGAFLKESFRDLDTIARIGGEEIAIIMPETSLANAVHKAERVCKEIAAHPMALRESKIASVTNTHMHATVSIGAACVTSGIESAERLFKESDRALYIAKNSGRNRVASA